MKKNNKTNCWNLYPTGEKIKEVKMTKPSESQKDTGSRYKEKF
jgi:hypothetical protein